MLQSAQAAIFEPWNCQLMLDFSICWVYKIFFIDLKIAKTLNYDQVDHCQRAKLFSLVNKPRDSKCDEHKEGVTS